MIALSEVQEWISRVCAPRGCVSSVSSEVQGGNLADMRPLVPDRCVVVAISKANAVTSVIYALQVENDGCIKGQPFPLHQPNETKYIWQNRTITKEKISFGSVLRYQAIISIKPQAAQAQCVSL